VPATIEVEEKTDACEACLLDLIETLRRATNPTEWSTEWPTESGYYWAWVRWRHSNREERIVIEVRKIADGPLYITSGAIVSRGSDFAQPTFVESSFCRIADPPAAPLPDGAKMHQR
jgi:hypothetical protein